MLSLLKSPLVIAGAAFVAGWIVALLFKWIRSPSTDEDKPGHEHQIRALDADLRVATKRLEEIEDELRAAQNELRTTSEASELLGKTLELRDAELAKIRKSLATECKKTVELRRELTGRAEETIRARVQIKDIATERDIAQAGSNVVVEHVQRLEAEKEDLTGRLERSITGEAGADEKPSEETSKETSEEISEETFILDS